MNTALSYRRQTVEFASGDGVCGGYLHLPLHVTRPPVVLMGNGLATEWHFGTADFIRAFTAAGMATLNFDYRHFGTSSGSPRQLIDFARQLEDWRAALAFLQQCPQVDATRLALWGSSLGGGHALTLAAEQGAGLRAVVAQVPHLDSRRALRETPLFQMLRTLGHGLWDGLHGLVHAAPHTLPVVAEPGELGMLTRPGWKAHYLGLVPPHCGWRNATPARSVFRVGGYRPIEKLAAIRCPALLVYGRQDAGIPAQEIEAAARRMAQVQLLPFEGDHFAVYAGPLHEGIVTAETAYLASLLEAVARPVAAGCGDCAGCSGSGSCCCARGADARC
ncbi:MAG: alpha/beta fold hydrolase [Sterolibacterium sp.]|nr:alpha/beta fold hydrolase [Sterolibacterium sp.]